MSWATYIPIWYLNSDEVYVYCPCCGKQYELTDSEIEDLLYNNEIEYCCCECEEDFYIQIEHT